MRLKDYKTLCDVIMDCPTVHKAEFVNTPVAVIGYYRDLADRKTRKPFDDISQYHLACVRLLSLTLEEYPGYSRASLEKFLTVLKEKVVL